MKNNARLFVGLAAAGMFATSLCAADQDAGSQPQDSKSTAPQAPVQLKVELPATLSPDAGKVTSFQKATTFIGMGVFSAENKQLGKVQDLVFDNEKGSIGYALVALDSAGDKSGRLVAVPLSALKAMPEQKHLVLNMSEPVLAAAPSLKNDELPSVDTFAVGSAAGSESGSASSSAPVRNENAKKSQ